MTRLVEWDRRALRAGAEAVLDVYAEAMGVPRLLAAARRSILVAHLEREGLRTVAALDDRDRLVGIAYGYVGAPGQWWRDQVQAALDCSIGPEQAQAWLREAFEVCELHVRPGSQGTGLGRALLDRLLDGAPSATALLTTPDTETRARGFYRSGGWVDLARQLHFPGDPRAFAVLGLHLPAPGAPRHSASPVQAESGAAS